jgi:hypothetical protein
VKNRGMNLSYSIMIAGICGVFVLIIYVYENILGRNDEIEIKEKEEKEKEIDEKGDEENLQHKLFIEYKKLKELKRKEWEERKEKEISFICSKCKQRIHINQDIYCYFDKQFCSEKCRNEFL